VLAGDGPERRRCEKLAGALGIGARVEFKRFVADPRPLYRRAAAAALASRAESLPNFLVEAHLHGVPSVALDTGGVAECGGIVIAGAGEEARARFAGELTALLFDAEHRRRESARVAAFAAARFSQERQFAAHEALFTRLLREKTA